MQKRIIIAITGLFLISLFFAFTFLVRSDILRPFDFDMTVKIQDNLPERAYRYLELIGESARFEIITILIFIVLALWRQWWQMIIVFGTYIGAHFLELIGKLILSQPPPPFQFYKLQSNVWFPSNYVAEGANSYPSGHSLRAFFLLFLLAA
jgi:membrane-associated phospholipid phosphatase